MKINENIGKTVITKLVIKQEIKKRPANRGKFLSKFDANTNDNEINALKQTISELKKIIFKRKHFAGNETNY